MTKFKFPLEAALRLRRLQVEAETAKLHDLNLQRNRLLQSIAAARQERLEASSFVQNQSGVPGADLRALSSFTLGVEARRKALENTLLRIEQMLQDQRQRLVKAEQNERSLSKLRETRLAEWRREFDRETEISAQELWLFSHTTDKEGNKRR